MVYEDEIRGHRDRCIDVSVAQRNKLEVDVAEGYKDKKADKAIERALSDVESQWSQQGEM